MCRTIVQESAPRDYMAALYGGAGPRFDPGAGRWAGPPPGPNPLAIHRLRDAPALVRLSWGCTPNWWQQRPVTDAQLGMLLRGHALWWPLLSQRVLVPADGWYEGPAHVTGQQARYFRRRDGRPIYIAGITAWRPGAAPAQPDGLAIITDSAMADPPDAPARPIVLPEAAARTWIDPATPVIQALQLACVPWREAGFPWQRGALH